MYAVNQGRLTAVSKPFGHPVAAQLPGHTAVAGGYQQMPTVSAAAPVYMPGRQAAFPGSVAPPQLVQQMQASAPCAAPAGATFASQAQRPLYQAVRAPAVGQPMTMGAVASYPSSAPAAQAFQPAVARSDAAAVVSSGPTVRQDDFMQSQQVRNIQNRCEQFLKLLSEQGIFSTARAADGRILRVLVPFCGGFFEAPTMARFFADLLSRREDIKEIEVSSSDVLPGAATVALRQVPADPRIRFHYEHRDLGTDDCPHADLLLGLHPEVTKGDTKELWKTIIAKCVRAAPLCVFATLHEQEAALVQQYAITNGVANAQVLAGLPRGEVLPNDLSSTYDSYRFTNIMVSQC